MIIYQSVLTSVIASLNKVFGETVTFTARGFDPIETVAVRMVGATEGPVFPGNQRNAAVRTSFDLLKSDVPVQPSKNDRITASDATFYVESLEEPAEGVWRALVSKTGR